MELQHKYSQLLVRRVIQLKQNGFDLNQIADDLLIPVFEVEEILKNK